MSEEPREPAADEPERSIEPYPQAPQQPQGQPPPASYPPSYPPPAPTGYGYPPPSTYDYGYAPPSYRNGYAITGLVLAIAGILFCGVPAPFAVLFSGLGMRDVRRGTSNASGLATAGLVLGVLGVVYLIAVIGLVVASFTANVG